jgi:hypothetical protein
MTALVEATRGDLQAGPDGLRRSRQAASRSRARAGAREDRRLGLAAELEINAGHGRVSNELYVGTRDPLAWSDVVR